MKPFFNFRTLIAGAVFAALFAACNMTDSGPTPKIQQVDSLHGVSQMLFVNGQLLAANRDTTAPGVAVIDTSTGKISAYYSELLPPSSMAATQDSHVVITETNYAQGAVSVLDLSAKTLQASLITFGSDNFADTANGKMFLFDHTSGVITGFTGHIPNANITLNAQTGAGSNPYDIAVSNGKAFISRYNSKSLLILDATLLNGGVRDSIDLSAYSKDTATHVPRMASVTANNGYVFVVLQRLNAQYSAHDTALVVVINASTKAIVSTIPLHFKDPISAHVSGNTWYLTGIAGYGDQLGGVEKIDLAARTHAGVVVTEATLAADVFDFVATSDHSGYVSTSTDYGVTTKLKKISF